MQNFIQILHLSSSNYIIFSDKVKYVVCNAKLKKNCFSSLKKFVLLLFQVMKFANMESEGEKLLLDEIKEKRKQLKEISMVDQFVAYAKLERKINALYEQYKQKGNNKL